MFVFSRGEGGREGGHIKESRNVFFATQVWDWTIEMSRLDATVGEVPRPTLPIPFPTVTILGLPWMVFLLVAVLAGLIVSWLVSPNHKKISPPANVETNRQTQTTEVTSPAPIVLKRAASNEGYLIPNEPLYASQIMFSQHPTKPNDRIEPPPWPQPALSTYIPPPVISYHRY